VPVLEIETTNVRRICFCDAFRRWGNPALGVLMIERVGARGGRGAGGGGSESGGGRVSGGGNGGVRRGLFIDAVTVSSMVQGGCGVRVDGEGGGVEGEVAASQRTVVMREEVWQVEEGGVWIEQERSPENYGPARQVLARPFLIVPGTQVCEHKRVCVRVCVREYESVCVREYERVCVSE
jgi:hypothetical protein